MKKKGGKKATEMKAKETKSDLKVKTLLNQPVISN